jgi:hypothetical protein
LFLNSLLDRLRIESKQRLVNSPQGQLALMESSYRLQATATEQKNTRGREREREKHRK